MIDDVAVAAPGRAEWALAMTSEDRFRKEQARLGMLWQLVGFTTDLRRDGDWKRSTLAGRSIFLQRVKDDVRGFENVCKHRGYPLRTDDHGNGAIRCGFHHWQYDKDGRAISIPKCKEMFGVLPRDLDVRLDSVEVATCGTLVFARFPGGDRTGSLAEYLGPGFDILQALWDGSHAPRVTTTDITANWRLGHHISLDDYHLVAVHPTTFGKNGYLPHDVVNYYRFGRHSAYFHAADEAALTEMAAACRAGTYRPQGYRILQFFPNLLVAQAPAGSAHYLTLQQYVPIAHDRTRVITAVRPAPVPRGWQRGRRESVQHVLEPLMTHLVSYGARRILAEDNAVCENMQSIVAQLDSPQILGRHEQRIGWFEENYVEVVGRI